MMGRMIHILLFLSIIFSAYAKNCNKKCKRNKACNAWRGFDHYTLNCNDGGGRYKCERCCKKNRVCYETAWNKDDTIKFIRTSRKRDLAIEEATEIVSSVALLETDCRKAKYEIGFFVQLPSEHFAVIFQALSTNSEKCKEDHVFHSQPASNEEGTLSDLKLIPADEEYADFPIFKFDAKASGKQIVAAFTSLPVPSPYDIIEHNCAESMIHMLDTLNIPITQAALDFAKYQLMTSERLLDYLRHSSRLGIDADDDDVLLGKLITRTLQTSQNEQTQKLGEKLNKETDAQSTSSSTMAGYEIAVVVLVSITAFFTLILLFMKIKNAL